MRCADVLPLVERYVEGTLRPDAALSFVEHVRSCARCSARIEAARTIVRAFAAAPPVSAPDGFFEKVMDRVYRQALAAPPALGAQVSARRGSPSAGARFYRRLGLSLVLTAGVLGASLLFPPAAYTTLVGAGGSAGISRQSSAVVRGALHGAESTVRGILGESPAGRR